jgi:hypothetical protein
MGVWDFLDKAGKWISEEYHDAQRTLESEAMSRAISILELRRPAVARRQLRLVSKELDDFHWNLLIHALDEVSRDEEAPDEMAELAAELAEYGEEIRSDQADD